MKLNEIFLFNSILKSVTHSKPTHSKPTRRKPIPRSNPPVRDAFIQHRGTDEEIQQQLNNAKRKKPKVASVNRGVDRSEKQDWTFY